MTLSLETLIELAFVIVVGIPVLIRYLASEDICFVIPETNIVKYAEHGGELHHFIYSVPGFILEHIVGKVWRFREAIGDEVRPVPWYNVILLATLGVEWYGFTPYGYSIRQFKIKKIYDNVQGTGPADWINYGELADADGIRFSFPRPYIFTDVELADQTTINLKIVLKLQLVNPYLPGYEFGNDFFTQIGGLLQSFVLDKFIDDGNMTITRFNQKEKKSEIGGMLTPFKEPVKDAAGNIVSESPLNQALIEQVGFKVVGISIGDWAPTNLAIRDAVQQQAIEEATGNARITKAEKDAKTTVIAATAYKDKLALETEADANRKKKLGVSEGAYIRSIKTAINVPGADPTAVATSVGNIIEMQEASSETSKITTLVKDPNRIFVPVGGDKK